MGLLSFFGGISQDIFLPILPLYLTGVLGLSREFIGFVEGLATSSSSIFKIIAGFLSDKFRARKPLVFIGYAFSLVGRFLLAFITSAGGVIGLRFLDGSGKGIKDSPKDALIADSSQIKTRGRSFGIVRALDTLGSVVGPLLLVLFLYLFQGSAFKYNYIFLITAIPLFFTLSILTIFIRETKPVAQVIQEEKNGFKDNSEIIKLPKKFYIFLGIMTVFALGNFSDAFLILRAQNVGVGLLAIPLVYTLFNFIYASASIPLGSLSDKIGREKVILIGWFAYALAYLGFAFAYESYHIWFLFAFYGLYYATTEGVAKAFVADMVSSGHRGKAYGIYNSVIGLAALPAGVFAGFLWDKFSPATPFFVSSILAVLAAFALLAFTRVYQRTQIV
ncbi:MFS transporter [Candidatus Wolfebacteria bacterium]|nr:MFS transporter [Candidatus Wolfebacteria bacterium]